MAAAPAWPDHSELQRPRAWRYMTRLSTFKSSAPLAASNAMPSVLHPQCATRAAKGALRPFISAFPSEGLARPEPAPVAVQAQRRVVRQAHQEHPPRTDYHGCRPVAHTKPCRRPRPRRGRPWRPEPVDARALSSTTSIKSFPTALGAVLAAMAMRCPTSTTRRPGTARGPSRTRPCPRRPHLAPGQASAPHGSKKPPVRREGLNTAPALGVLLRCSSANWMGDRGARVSARLRRHARKKRRAEITAPRIFHSDGDEKRQAIERRRQQDQMRVVHFLQGQRRRPQDRKVVSTTITTVKDTAPTATTSCATSSTRAPSSRPPRRARSPGARAGTAWSTSVLIEG